jgi:hypothetical protein
MQIDKLCLDHFYKAGLIVGWDLFSRHLGYPVSGPSLVHAITHHLSHEFFYLLPVLQPERIRLAHGLPDSRVPLAGSFISPHKDITEEFNLIQLINGHSAVNVGLSRHIEKGEGTEVSTNQGDIGGKALNTFVNIQKRLQIGQMYH